MASRSAWCCRIFLTDRVRHGLAGPPGVDERTIISHVAAMVPAGRLGDPGEVDDLVAFPASERAAHIIGAVHQIDGGIVRSNV